MNEDRDSDLELESFKRTGSLDIEDADRQDDQGLLQGEESVATAVLSGKEKRSIALLFSLYFIQGLPMMFSWATMPILLRQQLSYTLIGTYLVSQYPYSIKILWSPIVQSTRLPLLGRRKTWLVPCFLLGGLVLFWLAYHQDDLISRIADGETDKLLWLLAAWTILTILCANVRIALDDWALELISQANVHWASPTVTLAEITAGLFSFNLFLGFSSLGHPDAGARGEEVSTTLWFTIMGVSFTVVGFIVLLTRSGSTHISERRSVRASYTIILRIIKLPQVWTLMLVHLTSMIGFQANDAIAILQLVKNGFTDRDIAGLATISFPLEILSGILISRSFRKHHPWHVWRTLFPYRLLNALFTQACILLIHHYRAHHWRWFIAVVPYLISKQFEDMMFICIVSFHAQVADPAYGGIYLPLLATTLNVRYDVMGFVYTKVVGWIDGGEGLGVDEATTSSRVFDGYQIVNLFGVLAAIPVFWFFLRPATTFLQGTERSLWRVGDGVDAVGRGGYQHPPIGEEDEEDDDEGGLRRRE